MKYCNACKCKLILGENWLSSSKKINYYKCRSCKNKYLRDWRDNNPGAYKEWKYGITQDEYIKLSDKQNNSCAICKTIQPGGRHNTWHIDHEHSTGKVRGLLCWLCNSGLGKFKDNSELLKSAINYLEGSNES